MKKRVIISISILLVAALMLAGGVYALFYKNRNLTPTFEFSGFGVKHTAVLTNNALKNAGDTKNAEITVSNTGETPIKYDFELAIKTSSGLESALLVYFDDKFLGTLASLCKKAEDGSYSRGAINFSAYLYPSDSVSHNIKFEYHIGSTSTYVGKNCEAELYCRAVNADVNDVTFISDFSQLEKTILNVNSGEISNRTIVLSSDITFTSDLTLSKPLDLELNGYNLNFGQYKMILTQAADLNVAGARTRSNSAAPTISSGGFMLSDSSAFLRLSGEAEKYSTSTKLDSFDVQKAFSYLNEQMRERIGYKLYGAADYDIMGGARVYAPEFTITVEGGILNGAILSVSSVPVNSGGHITILKDSVYEEIFFEIITDQANIAADKAISELDYLASKISEDADGNQTETYAEFNYDLLLPVRFKELDCAISWWSSDIDIITQQGKYTPPMTNTQVTLIATFTVGDKVFNKEFTVICKGQNPDARLSYLFSRFGERLFDTVGQRQSFPSALETDSAYYKNFIDGKDLKIVSLSYEIDSVYSYLTVDSTLSNVIMLSRETSDLSAVVKVSAQFADDPIGTLRTTTAIVRIRLLTAAITPEQVFAYVQERLNEEQAKMFEEYKTAPRLLLPINYHTLDDSGSWSKHGEIVIGYAINEDSHGRTGADAIASANSQTGEISVNTANLLPESVTAYMAVTVSIYESEEDAELAKDNPNVELETPPQTVTEEFMFSVEGAIIQNETGFSDAEVFDFVKTCVGTQSELDYILRSKIDEANLTALDFSGVHVSGSIAGLRYFGALNSLSIAGSANRTNFSQGDEAAAAAQVVAGLTNLLSLNLSYCNMGDIREILASNLFTSVNLKGNPLVDNVLDIWTLSPNLAYLNLTDTAIYSEDSGISGVNYLKNESSLAYCYNNYLSAHAKEPTYWLTDTLLYRPQTLPIDAQQINRNLALEYAYRFSEVSLLQRVSDKTVKVLLPLSMTGGAADKNITIAWTSDDANASFITNTDGLCALSVSSSAPTTTFIMIIKLTVTVSDIVALEGDPDNAASYTRYFSITVKEAIK